METRESVIGFIRSETEFAAERLEEFMQNEYGKGDEREKPIKKDLIQCLTWGVYDRYDVRDSHVPAFVLNWCNNWHNEKRVAEVVTVRNYFHDGVIRENMAEIIEIISNGYNSGMFKFMHCETFDIIYQEFKKDLPGRGIFGGLGDDLKDKLLPFIGEKVTTTDELTTWENVWRLAFFINENWQELLDVYGEDEA